MILKILDEKMENASSAIFKTKASSYFTKTTYRYYIASYPLMVSTTGELKFLFLNF